MTQEDHTTQRLFENKQVARVSCDDCNYLALAHIIWIVFSYEQNALGFWKTEICKVCTVLGATEKAEGTLLCLWSASSLKFP